MYKGAIYPGLVLTAIYIGYVLLRTLITPGAAPALPPEARQIKEDDGSAGYPSLLVLLGVVVAIAASLVYFLDWEDIWAASAAGLVAYVAAVANRVLKLGIISRLGQQVIIVMMPPLALIFLVLGTIFIGLATPTEGGAMGATGAMFLAIANRRLSFDLLKQAMDSTAKLTAFVVFILVGARVFSLSFYGVNGDQWVEHLLLSLPGGAIGFLIVVNLLIFVLAFFLDFFELAFIIIPLLAKPAETLGIDLIWFGVLLGVNMQTSFMHPPFGFALFYLRSVAPEGKYVDRVSGKTMDGVTTAEIYWGAIPFVVIQVIMVGIVILFPGLVLGGLDNGPKVDPSKIKIELQAPTSDDAAPPVFK
jgi:tripartite ATP-independent transporter DctM subunit